MNKIKNIIKFPFKVIRFIIKILFESIKDPAFFNLIMKYKNSINVHPVIDSFKQRYFFDYLKKYYFDNKSELNFLKLLEQPSVDIKKPVIWTCWFQGLENANDIVKSCIKSMKNYSGDYEVIVITEDNMYNYVRFPDYIIKKYKAGIISKTYFSDLIRLQVLINFGGVWADSTVLFSDKIPDYILDSELFFFKSSNVDLITFLPGSSWFISARKNNPLLIKLLNLLIRYSEKENKLLHYYIFHISLLILIKHDDESRTIWNKIYYKNNSDPHVLQFTLFEEFNNELLNHIFALSFAHKLSYYFSNNDNELFTKENTFYKYITEVLFN